MDWIRIEKKFPKGYELVKEWLGDEGIECIRDLYDFFDEQRLHICITKDPQARNYWQTYIWDCTAEEYKDSFYHWIKDGQGFPVFSTRTEAEEQAFEKAFQILEERL